VFVLLYELSDIEFESWHRELVVWFILQLMWNSCSNRMRNDVNWCRCLYCFYVLHSFYDKQYRILLDLYISLISFLSSLKILLMYTFHSHCYKTYTIITTTFWNFCLLVFACIILLFYCQNDIWSLKQQDFPYIRKERWGNKYSKCYFKTIISTQNFFVLWRTFLRFDPLISFMQFETMLNL